MSHPFSCELTISLIVKNEVATLSDCLEALTPLRNEISCQLIITDTGSTDGTQEIAKQYADVFLEFDWCNDFAKARNYAIPHATGRWFFYLDADEICDHSLLEVVSFLKSPQSHTIGSATVCQRNYQGECKNLSWFHDFYVARLVNFGRGKRCFEGIVHESIPVHRMSAPLPVILHHDGYLMFKREGKEGRNLSLLRHSIEQNPEELKYYIHMIRESSPCEEKELWLEKAFSLVDTIEQGKDHGSFPSLLLEKARFVVGQKDRAGLEEVLSLLETTPNLQQTLPHLELLALSLGFHLENESSVEVLLPLFVDYRRLFLALQEKPDTDYRLSALYLYETPLSYHTLELEMVKKLKHSHLLEGGRGLLRSSVGYQWNNLSAGYPLLFPTTKLCLELELYEKLEEIRNFLKEQDATREFLDVSRLLLQHLKQKGTSSL